MEKALLFIDTTIGKKVVMALTGLVLFGFTLGHMLGNLQVFLGPEKFNAYGMGLHAMLPLLWGTRFVLLISFGLHVTMALQLIARSSAARPEGYRKKKNDRTTFAALTMKHSGITLLFFVLYHLAHFTFPGVAMGAYEHQHYSRVYTNVVNGVAVPGGGASDGAAMISLGLHLYHGSQSLLQTLGLNNPLRNKGLRSTAQFLALLLTTGTIILPLSVLLGLVR